MGGHLKRRRKATTDALTWPTRLAAAAELSIVLGRKITVATITKHWREDPTCPLPLGVGPITKGPLIEWAKNKITGRPPAPDEQLRPGEISPKRRIEEARARIAEAKAGVISKETLNAEDARHGLVEACNDLKRELLEEIPAASWAACQGKALEEAIAAIRELQSAALNRFAAAAGMVLA